MDQDRPRRTFRRADRLRASREYRRVSRRGRRAASRHFVVLVAPRGLATVAGDRARVGLTVSRRVGGAVVRNRVKRRLREWFRQSPLRARGAFDCVVIARPGADAVAGEALWSELDGLCRDALEATS